jgi:hypothetical protein
VVTLKQLNAVEFEGEVPKDLSGNWNLLLEPENKAWRLSGRLVMPVTSGINLLPNLK